MPIKKNKDRHRSFKTYLRTVRYLPSCPHCLIIDAFYTSAVVRVIKEAVLFLNAIFCVSYQITRSVSVTLLTLGK